MAYNPEPVPTDANVSTYVYRELLRISAEFGQIAEGRYFEPRYTAPAKPREGMIVIADGTSWNPGAGKGAYEYRSGAWAKL